MSGIVLATTTVQFDEPCLLLSEESLQSPGSRGFRRYQRIVVMRNAAPVEFRRDLGRASSFAAAPFRIPGGARDEDTGRFHVEHTVGELVDIADRLRDGGLGKPEPMARTEADFRAGFHRALDLGRRRARGLVLSGTGRNLTKETGT